MASPENTPYHSPDETDRLFHEMMEGVDFGSVEEIQADTKRELPLDGIDPQIAITSQQMLKTDETILVLEAQGALTPERAEQLISEMGNTWPFAQKPFTYSGRVMMFNDTDGRFEPQYVSDLTMLSQGFVVMYYPKEILPDTYSKQLRMAYVFAAKLEETDAETLQVLVMPEDSLGLTPPYDSALARAARYKRKNLALATEIEEGLATMERDDQSLMELRNFAIYADASNEIDAGRLSDALAYITIRANLDTSMVHFVSLGKGDLVQVGPEGEKYKRTLEFGYSAPAALEHILLLPEDVADGVGDGMHQHIPFLQMVVHENGTTRRLVAPLRSLQWIQSVKYAQATPPNFPRFTAEPTSTRTQAHHNE